MKIERPTHRFLERKEQEGKMNEGIVGSSIIVLGLAGREGEVPRQSAGPSLRILEGGGHLTPNIPTRKHKCFYEQRTTQYLDPKNCQGELSLHRWLNSPPVWPQTHTRSRTTPCQKPSKSSPRTIELSVDSQNHHVFHHTTQFIHLPLIP